MRSHLTAFGVGAGVSLLAAGVFALIAPRFADIEHDGDGVHIVNIGDGDSGSFHLKDKALNVSAEWKGDFTFAADGRSLTALKGRLEIKSVENGKTRTAVFENRPDGIVATAKLDDVKEPGQAEADRAAADLLQLFARSSGVNAEDRVKAMMASGGKERVLEEIGQLVGSHAVGAYVEALAGAATLTDGDVRQLAARVKGLESDYAKRTALAALLQSPSLGDAAIADILDAARMIEGDHELRLIVEELADQEMNERNFSVATALIAEIDGDHEVRLALSALLESTKVGNADAARALAAAAKSIEGDHELRLAVEAAGERVKDKDVGSSALAAIAAIEGAHERRLAIENLGGALDDASPHWLALIDLIKGVDSDYERRLAIQTIRSDAPETDKIRAALRKAAEEIGSDHERALALQAIEE